MPATRVDVDAQGVFATNDTAAMWRAGYHVFLIKVAGSLAGFVFVTRESSLLGEGEAYVIDELFVMRKYRRRGVGEHVVRTIFNRFPGSWEVSELRDSVGAQGFWRRVIGR